MTPKRGEVHLVDFGGGRGVEINKVRPALIIQNDITNSYGEGMIVAAISAEKHREIYPSEVLVPKGEGGLDKNSVVVFNQIRTIDKVRLLKRLGQLRPATMRLVDRAITLSLGLVEF